MQRNLLRMNWTFRISSSMAAYCRLVPSSLYSKLSIPLALLLFFWYYTSEKDVLSSGRIASPKILLWQKRCLTVTCERNLTTPSGTGGTDTCDQTMSFLTLLLGKIF